MRSTLVTRPKYSTYRRTPVARPLLQCFFCGIADHRCYTPNSFHENGLSQSRGTHRNMISRCICISGSATLIGGDISHTHACGLSQHQCKLISTPLLSEICSSSLATDPSWEKVEGQHSEGKWFRKLLRRFQLVWDVSA